MIKEGNRAENKDGTGEHATRCEETIPLDKRKSNFTLLNVIEVMNLKLALFRLQLGVHGDENSAVFMQFAHQLKRI